MEDKSRIEILPENFSEKPFGGYVRAWTLHYMSKNLSKAAARALFCGECSLDIPAMFTGIIEHDYLGRWRDGSSMRSWWIVSVMPGENSWIVETLNTRYKLVGTGRITGCVPVVYDFEVGKTLEVLDASRGLNRDIKNIGVVVNLENDASLAPMIEFSEVINAKNRI